MSRESLEAEDKKKSIYFSRNGICESCLKTISYNDSQLAHRIRKSKANIEKYGKEVIHHEANLALVCSLKCNSKVDISFNPKKIMDVLAEITEELL